MSADRESIAAVLAKNLVVARVVRGVTQQELAARADISRATIAQIETGVSDPRLSTIADLAAALGIPPILLLTGVRDVRAIVDMLEAPAADGATGTRPEAPVPPADLERMRRYLRTGMLKDRLLAARIGAMIARSAGAGGAAEVCSAIFSAVLPGPGTLAGIRLGRLIADDEASAKASA